MAVALAAAAAAYQGLAADTKPAGAPAGAVFQELDTGDRYISNGAAWVILPRPQGGDLWP